MIKIQIRFNSHVLHDLCVEISILQNVDREFFDTSAYPQKIMVYPQNLQAIFFHSFI